MRSLEWIVIQYDWCLYKKRRLGQKHTYRPGHVRTQGEDGHLQAKERDLRRNSLQSHTVHGILQARTLEWEAFPFSRGSSQPRSPTLQVDSLPAEPQGKPKNTGMGSLSLLQGIFLTQESNWGLLHCRWILCQLRYEGSLWTVGPVDLK